jgi:capsular polysaccharide biosynthesis protein
VTEQPVDLRRVWAAIGRARVSFGACVAVALLLAALFTVAKPPPHKARALVLLPTSSLDSGGQNGRDVATQVRIASSADVLANAAAKLRPSPRISQLARNVHVSAPTPDIIEFDAKDPSGPRAMAIVNSVADSYVAYSLKGASDDLNRILSALKSQSSTLNREATDLRARVATETTKLGDLTPGTTKYVTQSALVNDLRARLSDVSTQLGNVQRQINSVSLEGVVANAGTRVLERATRVANSWLVVAIRNVLLGLVLGVLVGTMVALFRDRRDVRLRRRDEIAGAAGVPAVVSLNTRVARSPDEWLELISRYEPSVDESWGLRRTLRHLVTAHDVSPARTTIVCLAGDEGAIAVAPQLASFSARAGVRTVLLVDEAAPSVLTLHDGPRASDAPREPVVPNLWLLDSLSSASPAEQLAPQLVIQVLVSEEGNVDPVGGDRNTTTLLAVTAGFATSDAITAVSLAASAVGLPLFGVIVANPRPDDDSSGRLPRASGTDGPRLPTRLTGIARGSR